MLCLDELIPVPEQPGRHTTTAAPTTACASAELAALHLLRAEILSHKSRKRKAPLSTWQEEDVDSSMSTTACGSSDGSETTASDIGDPLQIDEADPYDGHSLSAIRYEKEHGSPELDPYDGRSPENQRGDKNIGVDYPYRFLWGKTFLPFRIWFNKWGSDMPDELWSKVVKAER